MNHERVRKTRGDHATKSCVKKVQPLTEFLLRRTINMRNENLLDEVDNESKLKTTDDNDVTL